MMLYTSASKFEMYRLFTLSVSNSSYLDSSSTGIWLACSRFLASIVCSAFRCNFIGYPLVILAVVCALAAEPLFFSLELRDLGRSSHAEAIFLSFTCLFPCERIESETYYSVSSEL